MLGPSYLVVFVRLASERHPAVFSQVANLTEPSVGRDSSRCPTLPHMMLLSDYRPRKRRPDSKIKESGDVYVAMWEQSTSFLLNWRRVSSEILSFSYTESEQNNSSFQFTSRVFFAPRRGVPTEARKLPHIRIRPADGLETIVSRARSHCEIVFFLSTL